MKCVVDANLVVAIVLPLPYSETARSKMAAWKAAGDAIYAPVLWEYEAASVLRKSISLGLLDNNAAAGALHQMMVLNLYSVSPTEALHLRALQLAKLLGQSRAYDAQYLALAQELGAMLWTGDRRLANSANQLNIPGVSWIGDA